MNKPSVTSQKPKKGLSTEDKISLFKCIVTFSVLLITAMVVCYSWITATPTQPLYKVTPRSESGNYWR